MSTIPQLLANRANAKLSTGPRTAGGKKTSSQNARKNGLFISDHTLAQEEPDALAEILAGYTADYCPIGAIEQQLVQQLALATIRQNRLARIETGLLDTEDPGHTRRQATKNMTGSFIDNQINYTALMRAQAAAERSFYRAYNALETRRRNRNRFEVRQAPDVLQIEAISSEEPRVPPGQSRAAAAPPPAKRKTDPGYLLPELNLRK